MQLDLRGVVHDLLGLGLQIRVVLVQELSDLRDLRRCQVAAKEVVDQGLGPVELIVYVLERRFKFMLLAYTATSGFSFDNLSYALRVILQLFQNLNAGNGLALLGQLRQLKVLILFQNILLRDRGQTRSCLLEDLRLYEILVQHILWWYIL